MSELEAFNRSERAQDGILAAIKAASYEYGCTETWSRLPAKEKQAALCRVRCRQRDLAKLMRLLEDQP